MRDIRDLLDEYDALARAYALWSERRDQGEESEDFDYSDYDEAIEELNNGAAKLLARMVEAVRPAQEAREAGDRRYGVWKAGRE